jgi:hypothetical protein
MGVVVVVKTLEDNAKMPIINVKLTIDATWTFIEGSLATLCYPAYLQISMIAFARHMLLHCTVDARKTH